jgi:hypothetical protein
MGLKHCVYRKGSSYAIAIRGRKRPITQKGLSEVLAGDLCCETGSARSALRKFLGGDVFNILKKLLRGSKKSKLPTFFKMTPQGVHFEDVIAKHGESAEHFIK